MKLQSFCIVFALIIIPILLVLTYYIQLQVDTVTLQTEYDTKLLDATYDAMSSFEINTANEDLSSVSDALRTIIEASNNVFFNTLSTNLGMSNASKSYVEPYVPSILYALYDGYYIYAPTKVPEILTNDKGVALAVGDYQNSSNPDEEKYKVVFKEDGYYKLIKDPPTDDVPMVYNDDIGTDYGQILYTAKDDSGKTKMDGSDILYTPDPDKALLKTKNVLKTYMPYSARYKDKENGKYDINVTYTLDNYITIEGCLYPPTDRTIYVTKSGYLINTSNVKIRRKKDDDTAIIDNYSESGIQKYIEDGGEIYVEIDSLEIVHISGLNKKAIDDELVFLKNQIEDAQIIKNQIKDAQQINDKYSEIAEKINLKFHTSAESNGDSIISVCNSLITDRQYKLSQISSAVYYCKAYLFTNWVIDNFGRGGAYVVHENNIQEISGIPLEFENNDAANNNSIISTNGIFDFSKSEDVCVFDLKGSSQTQDRKIGVTEIDEDSAFYTHKLNVIRNSMQYNLNLAMTAYSENATIDYAMPIISDSEWEDILSNPTIVAFMQGFNCGLKTYNNYVIVSSTNNEISVSPNNIYYVKKDLFNDENSEYHKINCEHILDQLNSNPDNIGNMTDFISFTSKEIKYDKIFNKSKSNSYYWYDHKNLACYYCINDGNYDGIAGGIFNKTNGSDYDYPSLVRAYYMSLAKERNDLYKPNAVTNNIETEVVYDNNTDHADVNRSSYKALKDIDYIEIVFKDIKINTLEVATVPISVDENIGTFNTNSLNANDSRNQTRILNINSNIGSNTKVNCEYLKNEISINGVEVKNFKDNNNNPINPIKYIKVFYKK